MPKKFAGENTKAAVARARKEEKKETEKAKKFQEEEDAKWKDDDKNLKKKQQRKDEQDKKKQEQAERKAEAKALLDKEMSEIKKSAKPAPAPKVTRAQIESAKEMETKPTESESKPQTEPLRMIEENINTMTVEGLEARSVTEAINILSTKSNEIDKHPEKRMKAAYTAFEDKRLAELKEENPTLRMSQLKQMVYKEWQKSPENPLNK